MKNFKRSGLYEFIQKITNKKLGTIKTYFYRNEMDVSNPDDFKKYLTKYSDYFSK